MNRIKKLRKFKIFFTIVMIIIFLAIFLYLIPIMKNLSTVDGQINFKHQVESSGILGFLLLFGLQIAQIALVVLPGEPLEVLAGMCYGTVGGAIFIFGSVFITTTLIYYLVKKYGKKYVYEFFSKEKIDKIENSKLFQHPKKIELIMLILFLIPGTPKDLLVYLGGLLPIKPLKFILIATFGRFPSVISSTIAGEYISYGNWKMSFIIYGVTFLITGIVIFLSNKFDKEKITSDVINTIK